MELPSASVPELPEVETIRRQLAPRLEGRRVVSALVQPYPQFASAERAAGHRVEELGRRGKYLVARLDGHEELIVHLGMTGVLSLGNGLAPPAGVGPSHVHVRLRLDDGCELTLRDPRRFGRAVVVPAGDYRALPTLASLGPEPLGPDFSARGFASALARRNAPVKALLLGQRLVAGIGNIYADEALWLARVNPEARRLGPRRAGRLHGTLREVLAEAILRRGTTFRDYRTVEGESGQNQDHLRCYGRGGLPCLRCGRPLTTVTVAGRTSTLCRTCQRGG